MTAPNFGANFGPNLGQDIFFENRASSVEDTDDMKEVKGYLNKNITERSLRTVSKSEFWEVAEHPN